MILLPVQFFFSASAKAKSKLHKVQQFESTVMQIEKALINDRLHVSKVS